MIEVNKDVGVRVNGQFAEIIGDFVNCAGAVQLMIMECHDNGEIDAKDQWKIGECLSMAMLKIFTAFSKQDLMAQNEKVAEHINELLLTYYKIPFAKAEINEDMEAHVEHNDGTETFTRVINMQDLMKGEDE